MPTDPPSPTTDVQWRRRRAAYYIVLTALFCAVAYLGQCYFLFGKLRWIAPRDFARYVDDDCVSVVAAMKAYQRDHGALPVSDADLVPDYLPSRLGEHAPFQLVKGEFERWHPNFYNPITYQFGPNEGWYVRGQYTSGRIPLPPVATPAALPRSPATTTAAPSTRPGAHP